MKRRIYEKDGCWLLETTNNRGGNASATVCESKESAEMLLDLSEKWIGKTVRAVIVSRGQAIVARVVNAGVLHHKDELVGMLYLRWRGETYLHEAVNCEVIE